MAVSGGADLLRYSEESLRTFFDNAGLGIYISDYYTGEILMHNNIYAWEMGRADGPADSNICYRNAGYDTRCPHCPYERLTDANGRPLGAYSWSHYFEKRGVSLDFTSRAVYWTDGRLAHMVTFSDLSRHRKMDDNRNPYLLDKTVALPDAACLEYDIMQHTDYEHLIVLDIEGLRKINSIYSREGGDNLLRSVRDYILALNIKNGSVYRLGVGDFGILLRRADSAEMPAKIAEIIRARFEREWIIKIGDYEQSVFAFANICVVSLEGRSFTSFRDMYSAISYALDVARNNDGIACYDDALHLDYQYDAALEMSLENAVRRDMDGFYLEYQPIIRSDTYIWSGMEALCRWNSADFGPLSPNIFIPLAETRGLIREIGLWVLEQAVAQVKRWGLDRINGFLLDVNLSPFQLGIPNFDQFVIEILTKYDYPPERLCLEVTESGSLSFVKYISDAISRLCNAGVVIALDDFGAGISNLSALHRLPANIVKTDKAFLAQINTDSKAQNLFYAIIALAHSSDMKVVAEGVETEEHLRFLLTQGADYLQGYYFSRPLSREQLEEQLDKFYPPVDGVPILNYGLKHDLSPPLYKILYNCIRDLYSGGDHSTSVNIALGHVGSGLEVSRAYLFLKDPEGTYSNTHEWCAPGVDAKKDILQRIPLAQAYPVWHETLKNRGFLIASDIRRLDTELFKMLEAQGIKSVVIFPVLRSGELLGFVGFDDCLTHREWSADEVQLLRTLTDIINSYMHKIWLDDEMKHQSLNQQIVLNSLDVAIHVTDPETNDILFASSGLTRLYGGKSLVGRKCWEALENRATPCDFCPVTDLSKNPGQLFQWDHYCEYIGRHLRVCGVVVPWTNGRHAHLEYAQDVTELKLYQEQLEMMAATDMLTQTLNRQAFFKAAANLLAVAEAAGEHTVLAFIDLDDLKLVNDVFGHAAGDEMIRGAVRALKDIVGANDVLGRIGGDEFIVFFRNCSIAAADDKMRGALALFESDSGKYGCKYSFSYGLADRFEVAGGSLSERLESLIELADKRMLGIKKVNK